ncbi:MAG: ribonuclease H [Cyanobacteria bacterium J06636_16]
MNQKTPVEDTHQPSAISAIFTDGACKGNPGPGGWGVQVHFKDGSIQEIGARSVDHKATNNQMEMQAVIAALDYALENSLGVTESSVIKLYTDSMYVLNGITQWRKNWEKRDWKNIANSELWKSIDSKLKQLEEKQISVVTEHVRAHTHETDPISIGNQQVDHIASNLAAGKAVTLEQLSSSRNKFRREQKNIIKTLQALRKESKAHGRYVYFTTNWELQSSNLYEYLDGWNSNNWLSLKEGKYEMLRDVDLDQELYQELDALRTKGIRVDFQLPPDEKQRDRLSGQAMYCYNKPRSQYLELTNAVSWLEKDVLTQNPPPKQVRFRSLYRLTEMIGHWRVNSWIEDEVPLPEGSKHMSEKFFILLEAAASKGIEVILEHCPSKVVERSQFSVTVPTTPQETIAVDKEKELTQQLMQEVSRYFKQPERNSFTMSRKHHFQTKRSPRPLFEL